MECLAIRDDRHIIASGTNTGDMSLQHDGDAGSLGTLRLHACRLPVGLHTAGKPFDEMTVLQIGYEYEQRATGSKTARRCRTNTNPYDPSDTMATGWEPRELILRGKGLADDRSHIPT